MESNTFLSPNSTPLYITGHESNKGLVRANNEDRLALREFITGGNEPLPVLLAVLSDGVGGHRAGEVAAQIGVDTVMQAVAACESLEDPAGLLEAAIQDANRAVLTHSEENQEAKGMGATCVCVLLIGDCLFAANLGDSRAYLLQRDGMQQITHDHTWLEDNIEAGFPEMQNLRRNNPLAHVLNRYLGSPRSMEVDLRLRLKANESAVEMRENQGARLCSGDRILLCSDGLTDMLDNNRIRKLASIEPLADAVQSLVDSALAAGGHDNVSLILIQIPKEMTE